MTHEELWNKAKDLIARPWTETAEEFERDKENFLESLRTHKNIQEYIEIIKSFRFDECVDINQKGKEKIYDFVACRKYDEVISELEKIQNEDTFWCGAFDLATATIVEVHNYEHCIQSHRTFSYDVHSKLDSRELTFFYISKGQIQIDYETVPDLLNKVDPQTVYEIYSGFISELIEILDDKKAKFKT